MGQSESGLSQSYIGLVEAYKDLQLSYDEVEDELFEAYSELDANRASLIHKQRNMGHLRVCFVFEQ